MIAGDPSFLESVDIYFDKAAAIASTTPDILAQIKVGETLTGEVTKDHPTCKVTKVSPVNLKN